MNIKKDTKILVTGGAGFLGSHVVGKLRARGYSKISIPRSREYDLTNVQEVKRVLRDTTPDTIIHLAAVVGGIGANRDRPGEFFYKNLVMGAQLMEHARLHGIAKLTGFNGTITWDTTKPDGQPRRCLDTTRAEQRFGFKARVPFEEGRRKTIDWYKQTQRGNRTNPSGVKPCVSA